MIRGILAGLLWGAVIGGVVVALTSQLAGWRELSPAETAMETENGASAGNAEAVATAEADTSPAAPVAAAEPDHGAGDEISSPMLDTAPPETPSSEAPQIAMTDSEAADETPAVTVAHDVAPQTTDTARPVTGDEVRAAAAPDVDTSAPPVAPDAGAPAASAAQVADEVAPPVAPSTVDTPAAATASVAVASVEVADAPPAPAAPVPALVAPEPEAQDAMKAPSQPETPAAAPIVVADVSSGAARTASPSAPEPIVLEPDNVTVAEAAQAPVAKTLREASGSAASADGSGDAPQVLRINDDASHQMPGQRVAALPQIGSTPEPVTPEPAAAAPAPEEAATNDEGGSALDRNRVPFEAPEGASLISVVLVQKDAAALDLPATGPLAVPVTIAVHAGMRDATALARNYHSAGHEVVMIPDLPDRATAQDVEVALPVNMTAVPGAVAIMDADGNEFQNDRAATASVVAAAAESGLGLVTWPKGFNTAQKLAGEEDVPSTTVFRTLDEGDSFAVARALDQAAFRARQEGGTVLVGTADQATLDALVAWATEARRPDIALAPLSAVLLER